MCVKAGWKIGKRRNGISSVRIADKKESELIKEEESGVEGERGEGDIKTEPPKYEDDHNTIIEQILQKRASN